MNEEVTLLNATDEELIAEAKRRGYRIQKEPEKIKFLPCVCGRNQRIAWYVGRGMYTYECKGCGLTSPKAKGEKAARIEWNNMIEVKRKEMNG